MNSYLKKLSPYIVVKGIRYLRHFGWKEFWIRFSERMEPDEVPYGPWYANYIPTDEELTLQRGHAFSASPLFSILVPVYRTPENYLKEMLDSVFSQTYPNWELCIVNASPEDPAILRVIKPYRRDPRVRYLALERYLGISGNTNEAMKLAQGDFLCFLDHDDVLSPSALYQMALYLEKHPAWKMVYTDEDKITADGKEHFQPHFKPDFNLDLLRSNNYICHFLAVDRETALASGGFREAFDGAQDYDFIFRCAELAAGTDQEKTLPERMTSEIIGHIPEILYHWRVHEGSTSDNPDSKRYAYEAGKRAIEEHLARCSREGRAELLKDHGFYRVHYPCPDEKKSRPLVSVIIPNKDEKEALQQCIESVLATTEGIPKEILVVENNSSGPEIFSYYRELSVMEEIRLLRWKKPFNYSAINNYAARHAKGDYLLFLNNDTRCIKAGWLEELLSVCAREEVGAVGTKLLYPDDTIQHAGIVVGMGGVAGSLFVDMKAERSGYLHKASLLQDLSAVTAACMLVPQTVFAQTGGFDEALSVAFNDVDLCLRIRETGHLVVYDPYAVLYHDESRTRGAEDSKEKVRRFQDEIELIRSRWTRILIDGDPYYNKNLSLSKWNYSLKAGERMRGTRK